MDGHVDHVLFAIIFLLLQESDSVPHELPSRSDIAPLLTTNDRQHSEHYVKRAEVGYVQLTLLARALFQVEA